MLKTFYRKYVFQLTFIGFIVSLVFLIISSLGIFLGDHEFVTGNEFLQGFFNGVGNWNYWLFIVAITLTIACGWIFGDLSLKLSKFNKLIKTTSKATFVRNQDEIETLAWKLGPRYMDIVDERKQKFRIRN
ncbi:DUF3198 domain-containing protein [[Eubacterium] cellulosolvens]